MFPFLQLKKNLHITWVCFHNDLWGPRMVCVVTENDKEVEVYVDIIYKLFFHSIPFHSHLSLGAIYTDRLSKKTFYMVLFDTAFINILMYLQTITDIHS